MKVRPQAPDRVIAHVDLDCFYVQVERSLNEALKNRPVGVVQYNPFGDLKSYAPEDNRIMNQGSLIAVSYEARAKGVKRIMRGAEAKKVCPELILVQVPTSHGKADLRIYREASARILSVLGKSLPKGKVERASIDEVYLDVTSEAIKQLERADPDEFLRDALQTLPDVPCLIAGDDDQEIKMSKAQIRNGHSGTAMMNYIAAEAEIVSVEEARDDSALADTGGSSWFDRPLHMWSTEDRLMLSGAVVVNKLRRAVYDQLGFTCSAGIAPNKMLAKLASAMHKPNKQTLVPSLVIPSLMGGLPYNRIQGFGGKLGAAIEEKYGEQVKTMGDLLRLDKSELKLTFGEETAEWMLQAAAGVDNNPVEDRALPISIGCSKSFRQSNTLYSEHIADGTVLHWLTELAGELLERVAADSETNSRAPRQLQTGATFQIQSTELGATTAIPTSSKDNVSSPAGIGNVTSAVGDSMSAALDSRVADWHAEQGFAISKVCPMVSSGGCAAVAKSSLAMLTRAIAEHPRVCGRAVKWNITSLSLVATHFQHIESGAASIKSYFTAQPEKISASREKDTVSAALPGSQAIALDASKRDDRRLSSTMAADGTRVSSELELKHIESHEQSKATLLEKSKHDKPSDAGSSRRTQQGGAILSFLVPGSKSFGDSVLEISEQSVTCDHRKEPNICDDRHELQFGVEEACEDASGERNAERDAATQSVVDLVPHASDKVCSEKTDESCSSDKSHIYSADSNAEADQVSASLEPQSMLDIDAEVFLSLPADIKRELGLTLAVRAHRKKINSGAHDFRRNKQSPSSAPPGAAAKKRKVDIRKFF